MKFCQIVFQVNTHWTESDFR